MSTQPNTQNYSFDGGMKELAELTKMPMDDANKYILNRTHEFVLQDQYNVPNKRHLMPFYRSVAGEYWIINDSNIALMHSPSLPNNKQDFTRQVIVLLNPNTKIEIIKSRNSSWKEVFMINERGQRALRGWILTSTVKSAYKILL